MGTRWVGDCLVAALESSALTLGLSTMPAPVSGYFNRSRIDVELRLTALRLTVLCAACGFGKTAFLVNACRAERDRGATVFWLNCPEDAREGDLMRGLAAVTQEIADAGESSPDDLSAPSAAGREAPILLVVDDVELLQSPQALATINSLLRHGPPNLHIAMAMRAIPPALDIATPIVEGRGILLTAEDLRFTDAETAGYMGRGLPRNDQTTVARLTEGWPVALGAIRNLRSAAGPLDEPSQGLYREAISNHLATRLLRGLNDAQRRHLASLALLDDIDLPVLAAALPDDHARCWDHLSASLGGLIRPRDSGTALALHPTVRDILRTRLHTDDIDRARRTHRRFAEVLGKRAGATAVAVAHAVQAGDPALCEEIVARSGGLGAHMAVGIPAVFDICRQLSAEFVAQAPRLASMRIVSLFFVGHPEEALRMLDGHIEWIRADASGAVTHDNWALLADLAIVETLSVAYSCKFVDDWQIAGLVSSMLRLADTDWIPAAYRGVMNTMLMGKDFLRARFDIGRRRASLALGFFRQAGAEFGTALVDLQLGSAAMARGAVGEAAAAYARCRPAKIGAVHETELAIERNRNGPAAQQEPSRAAPAAFISGSFEMQAAHYGNRMETAFDRGGPTAAAEVATELLERSVRLDQTRLVRLCGAQRAFWLVRSGNPDAAQRAWVEADLPDQTTDLMDLSRQSWRELEAIALARIAWLGAVGQIDAARRLATSVTPAARSLGLKRMSMRCLASWSALEHRAGNQDAATARLGEFLALYGNTDYARPLVREGDASIEVLKMLLAHRGEQNEADNRHHARDLLASLGGAPMNGRASLSAKEVQIVKGLAAGRRNKEIARTLGLTESGLRYHLKRIYRTLGTNRRLDIARRARELGVMVDP